jgi:hypothetical protein
MNCRNLETMITELARGQMLDARVKADALAHAEGCARCAARFADEQSLTAGLRAVATTAATAEAPRRVEATLLSAFRQGAAAAVVPVNAAPQTRATPWLPWSIAAAAAFLLFSLFGLPRLLPDAKRAVGEQEARSETPAGTLSPTPGMPYSAQEEGVVQQGSPFENPEVVTVAANTNLPRASNRRRSLMQNAALGNKPARPANNLEAAAADDEITTDFLPLSYGSNISQLDDGQVVRLELPRSALQSFGLPVNAERAGERVKADVLLGHDGVARAIRFVR